MSLETAMNLQGALGAALVDLETGTCLPSASSGLSEDLSLAALVNARMLRAQMRLVQEQKSNHKIEDLLITFDCKYYLIRPIQAEEEDGSVFLFLTMDRKVANLALSRRKMAEMEELIAQRMRLDRRRNAARVGAEAPIEGERPAFMRDDHVMRMLGLSASKQIISEKSLS